MGYRLTIDPGSEGTGIAVWESLHWKHKLRYPRKTINLTAPKDHEWQDKADLILISLRGYVEGCNSDLRSKVRAAYIEYPEYFSTSEKGSAAAGSGKLVKLVFLAGGIYGVLRSLGIPTYLVPVNQWRGQVPERVLLGRIKARLPDLEYKKLTPHEIDAIGIGLHVQGWLHGTSYHSDEPTRVSA